MGSTKIEAVFSERVKAARLARGMKQSDLARLTGLEDTHISKFERGVRLPRLHNLVALCDHLGVSADYLLGRKDA